MTLNLKNGYKRTILGSVPVEWDIKRMSVISNIQRGASPRPINDFITDSEDGVHWIKIGDVDEKGVINDTKQRITVEGAKKSVLVNMGELLLSNSMSYGRPYILNINGYIHDGWLVISENNEIIRRKFLYNYLGSDFAIRYYEKMAAGSGVKNLNKELVDSLPVLLPPLQEQQNIANILSKADELIDDLQLLIEKKREYNKGLMQQLLTGKTRFTGFSEEWKEVRIKDIFDITRGEVIAKGKLQSKKDSVYCYPVYSSQTKNQGILGWSDTYDFEGEHLTWTTDGANAGKVFNRTGKFRCTNVCGVLVGKQNTIGYANSCIGNMLDRVTPKHVSYVGNPKLMNNVMASIKLTIPPLDEQTLIANTLSKADEEIELLKKELEQYKLVKKSLMQKLLTGEVRTV